MRAISIFMLICAAVASALAVPAHSRWALHSYSGKRDSYIEQPSCHPLKYFLSDPKRFDYGDDLFGKSPADLKDKVASQHIGKIADFTIHEVIHNINHGDLVMKMILVERKAGEFCEIFQQQYDAVIVIAEPAYLVNVNSETILATSDRVTGNGAFLVEEYWTFDKDGPIPLYATPETKAVLEQVFEYTFSPRATYPTRARVRLEPLAERNPVHGVEFLRVPVVHGQMEIAGFRMGRVAYLTDVSAIPESSFALLEGLDHLIVSALRHKPHPSHATVEQALAWSKRIGARQTWFTHIAHELGHEETSRALPDGIQLAYDGLSLPVNLGTVNS